MTILGTVYYDKLIDSHRMPGWARSERYEYCDGFYEDYTKEKKGILEKLADLVSLK